MNKTTTQPPPQKEQPFLSEAEMISLSAIYMLAVIAMIVGLGIYGLASGIKSWYNHAQMKKHARMIGEQIKQELTKMAMNQKEGIN